MTKGFLTQAWKDAQATAKKQSQQHARSRQPRKPKQPPQHIRTCDLCGRRLHNKHDVWCSICLKHHTMYPTPCESCDGFYHFPPGITDVTDPMHIARIADMDRAELARQQKGKPEHDPEPF